MLGTIPACVEDLNMDMLTSVEFQMDSAAYNDQQQVEELLLTPELQEILDRINPDPDALMYTSAAPPGVVFGTLKTASSSAADARIDNSTIAVIPLSVQQQQLDTYHIDAQMTAGQPAEYFTRDYLLPRSSGKLLACDAEAKLALIVAQCLSIHLSVHLCVCPRQLESRVCICTEHCASRATSTTGLFYCLTTSLHIQ